MSLDKQIEYGWCETDHKSGKKMRDDFPRDDYVLSDDFRPYVKETLESWGMPFPKEGDIFRGTNHDMLFVNSHGIIVRIGYTDIEDLISPTILQPIGWKTFTDTKYANEKFTISIYPGTEQFVDFYYNIPDYRFDKSISNLFLSSGQNNFELGPENIGVICINSDKGHEEYAQLSIDIDNMYNSSKPEMRKKRNDFIASNESNFENKADLMSAIIHNLYEDKEDLKSNIKGFDVHQSLRRMFWECDRKGNMSDLFNACSDVLDKPASALVPVWKKTANGFERSEIKVNNVVLYNSWSDRRPFVPPHFRESGKTYISGVLHV